MLKENIKKYSTKRIIEDVVIGLIVLIFLKEVFYKNYLMYKWHRGLNLPSKIPFYLISIVIVLGLAYLEYREWKFS